MMMIPKSYAEMEMEFSSWILTIKENIRRCLQLKLINKEDISMLNLKIH
jgi:hypothetical protein